MTSPDAGYVVAVLRPPFVKCSKHHSAGRFRNVRRLNAAFVIADNKNKPVLDVNLRSFVNVNHLSVVHRATRRGEKKRGAYLQISNISLYFLHNRGLAA